jgi:Mitochondrial branched-chain alpha-ketoacid dehydrogenase kinase/Histidine kinase-, DNA gyrase B-, and HSP90-like ATPase
MSVKRLVTRPLINVRHHVNTTHDEDWIDLAKSIRDFSSRKLNPITLQELVSVAQKMPSEESLLANAKNAIDGISAGLARRLEALRKLDYLIVLNPNISQIYTLYFNSFRVISQTKPPSTLAENDKFVEVLDRLVSAHTDTIPTLAKGFYEARKYMSIEDSSRVLDSHLRARIGNRLLAEHHIALTHPIGPNFQGAVQTDCNPWHIVRSAAQFVTDICELKYGVHPQVQIDQGDNITFPYIPVHLEYIFTEVLKNAFRAVIENQALKYPILVTVIRTGQGALVRIRDRGGGIAPSVLDNVFGFAFSTFDEGEGDGFSTLNTPPGASSIAGLGYGLPLSRAYAEFFGGKLDIQSYDGWGTDVYITIKSMVDR